MNELVILVDVLRAGKNNPRATAFRIVDVVRRDPSLASTTLHALNDMVRSHEAIHPKSIVLCGWCDIVSSAIRGCERVIADGLELDDARTY